jgi:hypothetical protein
MKTRYDGFKTSKYIHREDIEAMIIGTTDLWEDISDDGDGDYEKGELILSEEGERVLHLIVDILTGDYTYIPENIDYKKLSNLNKDKNG